MAEDKIAEMIRLRQAPAGITQDRAGRGRKYHELVFDRPNPAKDIPETLRRLEELGYFREHPEAMGSALIKADEAAHMPESTVDYQKGGHPFDTTRRSESD